MPSAVVANGVPDALLGTLRQQQQLSQAPHHHSDDALSPGTDPEGDRRHKVVCCSLFAVMSKFIFKCHFLTESTLMSVSK